MDPQEFLVAYSQKLPSNYIPIEVGVKPIMIDWFQDSCIMQ